MLTPREAERELALGAKLNPGIWEQHCISVGTNARLIAEKVPEMNSDNAYVMGLMHDIGRRAGVSGIRHIFDGYDYMRSIGQEEIARICLTHSFPMKDVNTFSGKYDCTSAQKAFLAEFIDGTTYDNYDMLIQLCDALSLPNGACIMEKRLLDVALRHGVHDFTVEKWKAYLNIKKYFDELCRCNIYELLPNVMENSSVSLV